MSCFLACFGASKHNNGRKSPPNNPNFGDHRYKNVSAVNVADKEDDSEKRVDLVADSLAKPEEQFSSGTRKKVTFDSNVKEYNHVSVAEAPGNIVDHEIGVNQNSIEPSKSSSLSESGSTVSSLGLYPPNHRYQNCRESDDDEEELDDEVSDLDEDEEPPYDEYCSDKHEFSAVSASFLEAGTKSPATLEVNYGHHDTPSNSLTPEMKITTPGFNQSVRDRAGYIDSVMNPIENTSQWRRAKTKGTFPLKEKENFRIASTFKPKSKNEVAVDASLSNWLVSAQKMPINKATPVDLEPISSGASMSSHGSNSVISQERPNLGALMVDELKQYSASSTSRKSPSRSPDEKPLIGTVGVHWNEKTPTEDSVSTSSVKGIPNTTSKYREDRKVNWHSTPFEKRLERALNTGSAEAYAACRACE